LSSKVTVWAVAIAVGMAVLNGYLLYQMGKPTMKSYVETNLEAQITVIERSNVEIDKRIYRYEKEITNAKVTLDRTSNVDDAIRGYFEILSNQAGSQL